MTDFSSILTAKESKKGHVKGVIIRQSDLKSGTTKNGKDWTMKTFTLQDASDELQIVAFDDEIKKLEVGHAYEIESPWWQEHEGKVSVKFGKYIKITDVGNAPAQTTMDEAQAKPEIPVPNENFTEFVMDETIKILQIEEIVKSTLGKLAPKGWHVNPETLKTYMELIYNESNKVLFRKANASS